MARSLSGLTTLRVGGEPRLLLEPATRDEIVDAALDTWASGEEWLLLGGGSNTVMADEGFDGTVIRIRSSGIAEIASDRADRVRLRVEAGHDWDALVAHSVSLGLSGIEALSGIPGSVGAAPVQNIGAYGQEVAETLVAVDFLDYLTGEVVRLSADELELGYRWSALKAGRQGVVLAVEFDMAPGGAAPVRYAQLANALGVELGTAVDPAATREAVLGLRASKGMVLDAGDPDTASAGSFFTNPIVSAAFAADLPEGAPRFPVSASAPPDRVVPLDGSGGSLQVDPVPREAPQVKLSAAWLIEHAGISRGFRLPGSSAAISSKHTLALTNQGGATADQIAELARYVQTRVLAEFGVFLHPEPVLVGVSL